MKSAVFFAVLLMPLGLCARLEAGDQLIRPSQGRQHETLRFHLTETLQFSNPFDLESNQVDLLIQQPDFSWRTLSFFYDGQNAQGVEQWEARFTPKQAGQYRFKMIINGGVREQFELPVQSNTGKKQGGLKISKQLGEFAYESGEAFRGLGLNVCWANDYEYYFRKMQAAGLNFTRIWMCPWNLSFEWQDTGLGRYNLESARKLDAILNLADQYGIFVILCMDYHGIARKGLGFFRENRWLDNPYNKINGGPCAEGAELFTNEFARAYFKKKYKYLISRFGYSSRLAAWEFYNEADLMSGKALPVNRWHIEMAEYIKAIDVHQRLVSSSSTRGYMEKLVEAFKAPALDFVMYHDYNSLDLAPHFTNLCELGLEYYQKPFVLAEFGVEFRGAERTLKVDPQHIGLHNGIWAGWFNETPVIPLTWWWDNYIDPQNLWSEFANLSRFTQALDFDKPNLAFKTLNAGFRADQPQEQVPCLVRIIVAGENCALWIKNEAYQWAAVSEGQAPEPLGAFTQVIPDLAPGRYTIAWYDPQHGKFSEKNTTGEVQTDGMLALAVPSFVKDLACVITRHP